MFINVFSYGKFLPFGEGTLKFLAASDNHGHMEKVAKEVKTVSRNKSKIFNNKDKFSRTHFIQGGDMCIDGNRTNFNSLNAKKGETIGTKQIQMFKKGYNRIKEISGQKNMKIYTVPGNHDLESWEDKGYLNNIRKTSANILVTNINKKNSPAITALSKYEQSKIKTYDIVSIKDSENPHKIHRVILLGLTPANMEFYCKGQTKGLDIWDKNNSNNFSPEVNLQNTYNGINTLLKNLKQRYHKVPVILVSHFGKTAVQDIINHLDNDVEINAVINAHDHFKTDDIFVSKGKRIPFISLSKEGEMLKLITVHFDKNGKFNIRKKTFLTKNSTEDKKISSYYNRTFKKDLKKNISVVSSDKTILSAQDEELRCKDNPIANTVTDVVLSALNKKGTYPKVEIFAMRRSAFRSDIPVGEKVLSNMTLSNVTSGLTEDDGRIYVGKLKGNLIADLIFSNILQHGKELSVQTRNPILALSGVRFNKTRIQNCKTSDEASKYIEVLSDGSYSPLNPKKDYSVALTKKLCKKAPSKGVVEEAQKFIATDTSVSKLLREGIKQAGNKLYVSNDTRVII